MRVRDTADDREALSFRRRSMLRMGGAALAAITSTAAARALLPAASTKRRDQRTSKRAVIRHIEERFPQPATQMHQRILRIVPKLDPTVDAKARVGDAAWAERERRSGPPLWLFESRNAGGLLALEGRKMDIFVYQIGNPLTAESMIRFQPAAALYAPLRFVLYDDGTGSILAYDRPSDQFGQFGDPRVTKVGRDLDRDVIALMSQLQKG